MSDKEKNMSDKEKAIKLLEEVNFNKELLEEIKTRDYYLYEDFIREVLSFPERLKTWPTYGSRDFSIRSVAMDLIILMTWEESGM